MKTIHVINKLFITLFVFLSIFSSILPIKVRAESNETLDGRIIEVKDEGYEDFEGEKVPYQNLKVELLDGSEKGKYIDIKNGGVNNGVYRVNTVKYKPNEKVRLSVSKDIDGNNKYVITGQLKRPGLILLVILFIVVVTVVSKLRGFMSIVGMIFSFIVIIKLVIPMLIHGYNPLFSAFVGIVIIIPVTFYISHGFNKKTHIGIIATIIGLLFTGVLSILFTNLVHLTGFASDETNYLQIQNNLDIKAIMLTGIIIGVLGVLDDITIGQASVVQQIKHSNPNIQLYDLYKRAMMVGQDHITSMVNTLILVYAGSALPLLLIFTNSNISFKDIIEFEFIAEEIVKMLVGSTGLVLIAPLTTILAAISFSKD